MMGLGRTGYPEVIPTHVYISFQHFFELNKLLNDMMHRETKYPNTTKKWIKFVQCHWERDMYQRDAVHNSTYNSEKSCDRCLSYVHDLDDKAIWWFELGTDKFIEMSFKNFSNHSFTFECCEFWIKIVGLFEVNLKVVSATEGWRFRRNFRVPNKLIKDRSVIGVPLPIENFSQASGQLSKSLAPPKPVSGNASKPLHSSSVELRMKLRDKIKTMQSKRTSPPTSKVRRTKSPTGSMKRNPLHDILNMVSKSSVEASSLNLFNLTVR